MRQEDAVPTERLHRAKRFVTPLMVTLLAVALFIAWMHPAILNPFNVGWLLDGQDRGQSAIGLAAYLRDGNWPWLHQRLLAAPEGSPLLFTDSIPLLGLVLGPIAPFLPPGLQFVGPWLLLCLILHAHFAWALVRPHAPDTLSAWLGTALLTLMPVLLNRHVHASLCAQWLILWALWIYVDRRRAGMIGHWVAVLAVAAFVHSYLLIMCAAIWGSALLAELAQERRPLRTIAKAAFVLAPVVLIAAGNGVFSGPFQSTGTYGAFPMALDALWNPAHPGYSALLPSSPDDDGRGFEGLQYLGAGMIALVITGVAVRIGIAAQHGVGAQVALIARLCWLLPAFIVIAVVAIGPQPLWHGEALTTLHPARWVNTLLDPVRAAGRLFWPATYTLAFVAILAAFRLRRATLVLAAALALQIVDLAPMLAAIRQTSAAANDPRVYRRARDPRWDAVIRGATLVDFQPSDPHVDLALMEEISWRAVLACRPTASTYVARETRAARARLDADSAQFQHGRIDPERLYILQDGHVSSALAGRVRYLDGVAIIPPSAIRRQDRGTACR